MGVKKDRGIDFGVIPRYMVIAKANAVAVKVIEGYGGTFSRRHGAWLVDKNTIRCGGDRIRQGFAELRALMEKGGADVSWIL